MTEATGAVQVLDPQTADIEARLNAEAEALDTEARSLHGELGRNAMRLAWICYRMKTTSLYKRRGYETVSDWRIAAGIGRSTYYRGTRIVEALAPRLDKEELLKLPLENSDWLARLPESKRYDPQMLEDAKTMTEEKFIPKVTEFLVGAARPEERSWFRRQMYISQINTLKQAMAKIAKENEIIDNDGRVLEIIAATILLDEHGAMKVLKDVVLPKLKEIRDISDTEVSAAEQLEKVYAIFSDIVTEIAKVVSQ